MEGPTVGKDVIDVEGKIFVVREPATPKEHRELMDLEREIWDTDYTETFPYHITIPLLDIGGIVLGVYEEESGRPVGMVVMMPGFRDGKVFYYSHMLGLLREYRGKGIGKKLKEIQRRRALLKGIDLIEWTYEPLLSRNAWFNLVKMGVVVRRYKVNYYGITHFEYSRGIETDRFVVEWYLKSPRVVKRMKGNHVWKSFDYFISEVGAEVVLSSRNTRKGFPEPGKPITGSNKDVVLVEIPGDFTSMQRKAMDVAVSWRLKSRVIFKHYLSRGYVVIDLIKDSEQGYYYVLWKHDLNEILGGDYP